MGGMGETPARLLRLLSLLQSPREWSGGELAGRLGVSRRTIRRDVDRLRDLGYPVRATMGAVGGYRLVAGTAMPPLLLDDEEAVAIAVGLRTAAGQAIAGIEDASVRALAKLVQVLPARLRHRVRALDVATVPVPGDGPTLDPDVLTVLAGAVAGGERVRFAYRAVDGRESERLVEPHRMVAAARRWYLVAFDVDRDDWRTFRVDRVRQPVATGWRAAPRAAPFEDAAAYVTARLYGRAPTYRAVATVEAPAAYVAARLRDTGAEVESVDQDTCRLRIPADTLEWLAFRLTLLDRDFQVHEPPELAAHVRALATRLSRAAGR
jgi:predicted DNA-binding transcriptional regulator YafY